MRTKYAVWIFAIAQNKYNGQSEILHGWHHNCCGILCGLNGLSKCCDVLTSLNFYPSMKCTTGGQKYWMLIKPALVI